MLRHDDDKDCVRQLVSARPIQPFLLIYFVQYPDVWHRSMEQISMPGISVEKVEDESGHCPM